MLGCLGNAAPASLALGEQGESWMQTKPALLPTCFSESFLGLGGTQNASLSPAVPQMEIQMFRIHTVALLGYLGELFYIRISCIS